MKFRSTFFGIMLISVTSGYGQSQIPQTINASGGITKNKGYTTQWSIGELTLVNEMDNVDSTYIITNGFIQPTDGLVPPPIQQSALSLGQHVLSSANLKIFPNPTRDILDVELLQSIMGRVVVQLSDELGHIVYTHELSLFGSGLSEKINMRGLMKGVYILYIKKLNPVSGLYELETGSYKIIKL
jgi:Secretion system C-terminal sorting domain